MRNPISGRLEPVKESAIRRFIELASKSKDASHFEHGEPSFSTPDHIVEAAIKAMRDGHTHYGPTPGLPELRKAISEKLTRENRIPIDGPEEVLVVSGTQEGMFLAAMTFLQPGDEALVLDPYYPAYFEETLIAGAKPVTVPLSADSGYRIDAKHLEQYVTPKTRMVWLNSPANPTGHVFSKKDLEEVAAVAERNDLLVFTDEIYEKLVYDGAEHVSIGRLPGMEERVITTNGFSKCYAMAGWRIGYLAADKTLIDQMSKLHYYAVLCASTIAQIAGLAALNGPQDCVRDMVQEYDRRRSAVLNGLAKIAGISYVPPKGAFYVFPNISAFDKNDEGVAETLIREFSVATVPGSGFGRAGAGHLRISYSVPMTEIEEGLNRFQKGLQVIASHKAESFRSVP
jgi:aspartate/methionine/tyrosine aminotransferase